MRNKRDARKEIYQLRQENNIHIGARDGGREKHKKYKIRHIQRRNKKYTHTLTFYTYTYLYLPSLTRDVNLVSLVEKAHGKDSMPVACT